MLLKPNAYAPTLRALLLCAVSGCGAPPEPPGQDDQMKPPDQASRTFTLQADFTLEPGQERYQCFITQWERPGGLRIKRIVPRAGEAVHHLGVFTDVLRGERQAMRECREMGLWGFVYGAGVGTGPLDMPRGTAMEVEDGTPLILQVHYLNAGTKRVESRSAIDLELAGTDEQLAKVGSWIVGSTRIELQPRQQGEAQGTCTQHPTFEHVFAAFPHMHKLGTSLSIAAGDPAREVFSLPQWDFGDQGMLPVQPEVRIDAMTPIRTRCTYNNTTGEVVRMGLRTQDEMCVTVLYYWPEAAPSTLALCQR